MLYNFSQHIGKGSGHIQDFLLALKLCWGENCSLCNLSVKMKVGFILQMPGLE